MQIKKAVIPAAGFGTRFLPFTKEVPKELIPIIDKPAIEIIVDAVSDLMFCPTDKACANIKKSGVEKGIFKTGNTVIDALLYVVENKKVDDPIDFNLIIGKTYKVLDASDYYVDDGTGRFIDFRLYSKSVKVEDPDNPGTFIETNPYYDATQGTYSTVPAGMECGTQKFKGGTTCYVNCLCSKTKFPFAVTEEDREKFVLPTSKADMCTDSTGTYYASVACAEGYYSRTELNKVPMSMWFNYGTPIVATNRRASLLSVNCFDPKNMTCGGTSGAHKIEPADIREMGTVDPNFYKNVVVFPKGEPIRYYVKTFATTADEVLAGTYPACVVPELEYAMTYGDISFSTVPTKASCAEYVEATAKYLPGSKYYYYNGNCMDNGLCTTSTSDCVNYTSETFTSYNPSANSIGNGSCRKISGCKTGWNDEGKYFCTWAQSGESVVPTGIAHTTVHSENALHDDCIKVTGCATGYAPIAFREGTYGTEVNDVTKGYNANNIVSFTSPQDPNDNTFGMAVCEKTVPCTVGTYYNEETKACTASKAGGRKYFVTETTSDGKCTVMGTSFDAGMSVANYIDWEAGGENKLATTVSQVLNSVNNSDHNACYQTTVGSTLGIADVDDYQFYLHFHYLPTDSNDKYHLFVTSTNNVCVESIDSNAVACAPNNNVTTQGGHNAGAYSSYAYVCKSLVDCGSTANSPIVKNGALPGRWYDSKNKVVKTDGSGDFFIVNSNLADEIQFEAVNVNGYSQYTTSKVDEATARAEAKEICSANGGTLVSSDELSLIMTDSAGIVTEGGDDGTTVTSDGCYSYTNNCGTTTKYNVVCKYSMSKGSGSPFVGSPNISCRAGQYYNSSTGGCISTATDWIVVSNGTTGLKLAYVGGGYVTPSQYTANVSSAQTYGFDSCVNNEFDGLLTTSEMESLGADVINSFTTKLGQAGMMIGNSDTYLVVSDGKKCVDVGILGADSYGCPSDYYSVMCQVTLTPTKTTLPDVAPMPTCAIGRYFDMSTSTCTTTRPDGSEIWKVLSKSGTSCTIVNDYRASVARVVDWEKGGTSSVVTNSSGARTAGEDGCYNQGGTLLTTAEVRVIGSTPFENATGFTTGFVVTSDGCLNLNNNTTTCPSTAMNYAYACKFSATCN